MSNDFIQSVCAFLSLLTHLRYIERTFACSVWLMCVIISQFPKHFPAFMCTSSFVAYLDWLVSLRTTWDRFVWLGTLKYEEHDQKLHCLHFTLCWPHWFRVYIIHLLTGFCTSSSCSGAFLHGCTMKVDRGVVAWVKKVTLIYMFSHCP